MTANQTAASLLEKDPLKNTSPNRYFRVSDNAATVERTEGQDNLHLPPDLIGKLQPGDGLVVASWDEANQWGQVSSVCVVVSIDLDGSTVTSHMTPMETILKPNPSGRRWWRNSFFKFAESVRERYMLDDLFAESFPQYSDIDLGTVQGVRIAGERIYQKTAGYIYVLRSPYGYKIGKTVNLKDRTRLFEVKLPFKFDIALSVHVDNYSKAESDLHWEYASKRLEGEWFDLDEIDLEAIRSKLKPTQTL